MRQVRRFLASRAMLGVAIACGTVLAVSIGALQQAASMNQARAISETQDLSAQGTSAVVSGVLKTQQDFGAYRDWIDELARTQWALERYLSASSKYDGPTLVALAQADQDVSTWTRNQSPLLQPPYFDEKSNTVNTWDYEVSSIQAPAIRLRESTAVEQDFANAWGDRATGYVTLLTVVAVAVFFLGLAATVGARTRRIFASLGLLVGAVAATWSLRLATNDIHRVPGDAVESVVTARAELAKGEPLPGEMATDADLRHLEAAVSAAGAAVVRDPGYLRGRLASADIALGYGGALVQAPVGPKDKGERLLKDALDSYRTYLAAVPDDQLAWWNAGWGEYLLGQYAVARTDTVRALTLAPGLFPLYLNLTAIDVALGDNTTANHDVDLALRLLDSQTRSSDSLYLQAADVTFTLAAADHPPQATTLLAVRQRLREAAIALRVRHTTTPAVNVPAAQDLRVFSLRRDEDGAFHPDQRIESKTMSAAGVRGIEFQFGLASVPGSAVVSVRVWRGTGLAIDLQVDEALPAAVGGRYVVDLISPFGRNDLPLSPGDYTAELYLNGTRLSSLAWTLSDETK